MRVLAVSLLLVGCLRATGDAAPAAPSNGADPVRPADSPTPWIDLAPSKALEHHVDKPAVVDHKLASALTLGGLYVGFTTWTYFAWYRKHKSLSEFKWGCILCDGIDGNIKLWSGEGWLGSKQYAGGADKFGHLWATMGLARAGTELLQWGGYDKLNAAIVGTALSEALFIGVEVKDGFYYEFSFGDLMFDTAGAVLGFALSMSPRLDELIDFRVEYWPSKAYRRQLEGGNVNIAEDYTGETYLLAFHLGGVHRLRDSKYGGWSRFLDVALGYETRGYKPEPPPGADPYPVSQHMFIGVSLNAQGFFDWLLEGRSRTGRKITHGLFEVFNVPYGSLPLIEHTQSPSGTVTPGGA